MIDDLIRILLVEDNPGDALLVSEALAEAGPGRFSVAHADRISSALTRLDEGGVDLILLDLSLPDSQGLDSFDVLHAREQIVPIIVLSGSTDEALALEAVERGAQDYLVKGRVQAELLARSVRYSLGRSRAEQALRESESAMRAFQDASPMMMGVVELVEDDLLFVSPNAITARYLGLPLEALRGQLASRLDLPRDYTARWVGRCLESQRSGGPVRDEFLEETALGPRWISSTVCQLAGTPLGRARFSYVMEDVTERNRAEREQARLIAILDATTDFVGIADPNGRAVYVNRGGLQLIGRTEDDVPQTLISDYHPAWANEIIGTTAIPTALREGTWSGELAIFGRDGSEIPVSAVILALNNPHEDSKFLSCIYRNISDRKRAEREIQTLNAHLERRVENLAALRSIDTAINSSFDLRQTLDVVISQVFSQLGVDAASIWLCEPNTRSLTWAAGRGFDSPGMAQSPLGFDSSLVGQVARDLSPLHLKELAALPGPPVRAGGIAEEGFESFSAVPLISKGKCLGILEVFQRTPLDSPPEWRDFMAVLADQAAIAVENFSLIEGLHRSNLELCQAYDSTIDGWSRALDLRDKETEGHSQRVTSMTLRLAHAFGFGDADLAFIRRGALLHDIGKLGVPDAILLKPGPLTDDEWAVMRRHPTYAYEWLSSIEFLQPALEIPYCHHEKWDGSGYPRGLAGEQIPLTARLFAAVDICDALLSDRPYRKGWPVEKVREHIRSLSGTHLDPRVVEAFLPMIGEPGPTPLSVSNSHFELRKAGAGETANDPEMLGAAFRALLEHSDDFVVLLDGTWRIQAASLSFVAAFVPGRDPRGLDFIGLLDTGSRHKCRALLERPLDGAVTLELNHRTLSKNLRLVNYNVCELARPRGARLLMAVGRGQEASLDFVEKLVQLNQELEESRRILAEHAMSDPLTGLGNRRWLFERMEALWAEGRRQGRLAWVMMADLDHFKAINDTYGHQAGDEVLVAASRAMRETVRTEDLVARYGGEEFVMAGLCDHESDPLGLADRILEAVRDLRVECPGGPLHVTISIGVVMAEPAPSSPPWLVLQSADRALYRAKAGGRDRCKFEAQPDELGRRTARRKEAEVMAKIGVCCGVRAS